VEIRCGSNWKSRWNFAYAMQAWYSTWVLKSSNNYLGSFFQNSSGRTSLDCMLFNRMFIWSNVIWPKNYLAERLTKIFFRKKASFYLIGPRWRIFDFLFPKNHQKSTNTDFSISYTDLCWEIFIFYGKNSQMKHHLAGFIETILWYKSVGN
jgi:hypothetical protein